LATVTRLESFKIGDGDAAGEFQDWRRRRGWRVSRLATATRLESFKIGDGGSADRLTPLELSYTFNIVDVIFLTDIDSHFEDTRCFLDY
jgi:hypothetical protein